MAQKVFRLPDLGEGLTESEIVSWRVSAGDAVTVNQILAEVETAKAVVEVSSPFEGTVAQLHAQEGVVLDVGAPMVTFEVQGSDDDAAPADVPPPATGAVDGEQGGRVPTLVGYGAAPEKGRPARRRRAGAAAAEPAVAVAPVSETGAAAAERPRSTPPVRLFARRCGVDLETLTGTGAHGVITREDVERARAGGAGTAGSALAMPPLATAHVTPDMMPDAAPGGPSDGVQPGVAQGTPGRTLGGRPRLESVPVRGVRKVTAAAMVRSAFTAPHVTEFLQVDVTESLELIAELKGDRAFRDVKITPMTLAARACVLAMERTPDVNARWDEASGAILQQNYVNFGFAAATPRGLVVPNVKEAQGMDLRELAESIAELTQRARAGALGTADLTGGTFTLTNVGVFGVDTGTPIINPGEAAILCLGAVRRLPWEHRGEIALRDVVTLSLSFDHRLVDGEQGSRFLADVGAMLGRPGRTLALA